VPGRPANKQVAQCSRHYAYSTRWANKTGPLRFTACNFRSIDQIGTKCGTNQRYSFLTLPRNLFETTMENKVAPANEWQWPWRALLDFQPIRSCFATTVKMSTSLSISYGFFVDVHSTFMSADELFHKFDVFRNSDVQTDRGRFLLFGRSVTPVELIFFSSRFTLVLACLTGKLSQQRSWALVLLMA